MKAIVPVLLSFCSLFVAVAIFSAILGQNGSALIFFLVTMMFAFPVWLIDLLLLFLCRNMGEHERWLIPLLGGIIGPLSLILWCGILVLQGVDWRKINDLEVPGLGATLVYAFLIGLFTNTFYVVGLRTYRRHLQRAPD